MHKKLFVYKVLMEKVNVCIMTDPHKQTEQDNQKRMAIHNCTCFIDSTLCWNYGQTTYLCNGFLDSAI